MRSPEAPSAGIEIVSRNVTAATGGGITVEWKLDRTPDDDWKGYLRSPGVTKTGTIGFIQAEPYVISDMIRITVPDADLESAVRWVEAAAAAANQKYETYVVARARQREAERQAAGAEAAASIQRAQERLRKMDEASG